MKFFSLSVFIGAVLISLFFISRAFEPVEYISERLGLDKEKKKAEVQKVQHLPTPEAVRGIYMTSWVSGTKDWRADMVNFIDKTEINSIVIDVKDYSGRVSFDTGDEKIKEIGSEEIRIKDLTAFIEDLHKKSIYTIARITVFQDPFYSKKQLSPVHLPVWPKEYALSFEASDHLEQRPPKQRHPSERRR